MHGNSSDRGPWKLTEITAVLSIKSNVTKKLAVTSLEMKIYHISLRCLKITAKNNSEKWEIWNLGTQKVTFSLSTPRRHTGEVDVRLQSFLASAIDWGEWLNSRPGRLISGKGNRCPLNGRRCGLQNLSERFGEESNIIPLPRFETPDRPTRRLFRLHYSSPTEVH
jgi:hypothetical protein